MYHQKVMNEVKISPFKKKKKQYWTKMFYLNTSHVVLFGCYHKVEYFYATISRFMIGSRIQFFKWLLATYNIVEN